MGNARAWQAAAAWTGAAVLMALIVSSQQELPFRFAVMGSAVWYYALGIVVWVVCALNERWTLWARPLPRALVVHLGLGVAAIAVWGTTITTYYRVQVGPEYWSLVFPQWPWQLLTTIVIYAASLGVGVSVQGRARARARREREAQLEAAAREAELAVIKAQLQPHFLLNSLNSILALVEEEPAEARRMLVRLSSLLHSVFDRLDEALVPLERELDTVRDYLEIEQIRFGERLTFSIDADAPARQLAVPPFLLQPIVENAVKHGIEPASGGGIVRVTARLEPPFLRLAVADTGRGFHGGASNGRGLTLTRKRLDAMYGRAASLTISGEGGGCRVTLDLPLAAAHA
jgi:signal transduction histidine kinase